MVVLMEHCTESCASGGGAIVVAADGGADGTLH